MTVQPFIGHLTAVAVYWRASGEDGSAAFLEQMIDTFRRSRFRTLRDIEGACRDWASAGSAKPDAKMIRLIELLLAASLFVDTIGTKAAANSLNAALRLLKQSAHMKPGSFLNRLRVSLSVRDGCADSEPANENAMSVEDYVGKLRAAIGDDTSFKPLFAKLSADATMTRERVVEIASAVAFKLAKSTSRKAALARILEQHEVSEATGAKIRANDGRSAA